MRALLAIGLAAALIAAAAATGGDRGSARAATTVTITARDFFWSPDAVTIQQGDTVVWTNAQGFHNVLLGDSRLNQPGFPADPQWNPPPQRTFNEPGSYTFVCEVHPGMTGTVNVQGAGPTPTPTPTPTPEATVPPPGTGAPADNTPPALSGLQVAPGPNGARVTLTVSELATVNARFVTGDDVVRARWQVEPGTRTLDRQLAGGTYTYELWAVDANGNR